MADNSFKIKNSLVLSPIDLTTLTNPQAGDLACDINDSNKIKRYDANSSAWTEVGSGGVGSVDIMFVQDFESASLSTFESPTDVVLSTTDPLHGRVSAILTHDASVNKSFKQIIPVDRKFRGQAIVLDLNIKSAASAGNVTIKITDESAPADLIASEQLQLSSDVSGRRSSVSFTIPSTCESLSYTITALPEAGSPVTRIDDIVAMLSDVALLETSVEVPSISNQTSLINQTANFANATITGATSSTTGSGIFSYNPATGIYTALKSGIVSISASLVASAAASVTAGIYKNSTLVSVDTSVGSVGFSASASAEFDVAINDTFKVTNESANTANVQKITVSASSVSTTTKTIPLTQSGLVQEADSYIRATGSTIDGSLRATSASIAANIGSAFILDNSSGFTKLKVTEDGIYNITFNIDGTGSTLDRQAQIQMTGFGVVSQQRDISNGAGEGFGLSTSLSRYITTTDELFFTISGSSSRTYSIQATKQGSLKQVSVSSDQKITIPTSELRFEGASSRGTGTETGIVQFSSLAKLRGDAFTVSNSNGTAITMTKAGLLSVSTSLYQNTALYVYITKNQAVRTSNPTASEILSANGNSASAPANSVNWTGMVQIGDVIRIYATAAPTSDVLGNLNLSFQEQDISVSVTNTLPQFSESDSCVRLDTANGYGSTGTKIRRFSNVRDNIGTDIEYLDSATNGASFTAKSSGIYMISYSEQSTLNTTPRIGLSKNASSLINNIDDISANERLAISSDEGGSSASKYMSVSWQGYLQSGDIIRPHSSGQTNTVPGGVTFTISKVGKPNVTGVDVTPFVNIPLSKASRVIVKTYESGTSWYEIYNDGWVRQGDTLPSHALTNVAQTGTFVFQLRDTSSLYSFNMIAKSVGLSGAQQNLSISAWTTTTFTYYTNDGQTGPLIWTAEGYGSTSAINALGITISNSTTSDYILTPPETFSTDTASLQYAPSSSYTLSTLQNAPVGTYITFTYAANTNTRTQTSTRPTQTDADMNANGLLVYTRAYNAASTAASPAAIAIQIGKGLKGKSLDLYKSAGKVTAGSLDAFNETSTVRSGAVFKEYNELTGILIVDAGYNINTSITSALFYFSDITTATSGYLVINASKSPALTGVPLLLPRIATLSDVKASGTAGGTATSGSYQTRTLNTLSDPSGIVTSLASNQFTLPAGEYYIEASAPACFVGSHKAKIRNVTDAVDAIIGTSEVIQSSTTGEAQTRSIISGSITLSSIKTFELQHRVVVTRATDGFGQECVFGDNEVYSIIKITKVK
jgi:hypothetical protein